MNKFEQTLKMVGGKNGIMECLEFHNDAPLDLVLDAARVTIGDLQRFKDWCHRWLDAHDVPSDPDPEKTKATGCRISGRMEWLWARTTQGKWEQFDVAQTEVDPVEDVLGDVTKES